MLTSVDPLRSPDGGLLYRDDTDPALVYTLPSGLSPRRGEDGHASVTLIFYRTRGGRDGARLVGRFAPQFPALDLAVAAATGGAGRVQGAPMSAVEATLSWNGGTVRATSPPALGTVDVEMYFSLVEAQALRAALLARIESVELAAVFGYWVSHPPLAARVRLDLRGLATFLGAEGQERELSGAALAARLSGAPSALARLEPDRAGVLDASLAARIAPMLAPHLSSVVAPSALFARRGLRLREPESVPLGDLLLDLSRLRQQQEAWQATWSLSEFHREASESGRAATHFPEVSAIPAVGTVPVLIENLLPVDGLSLDRVLTRIRYKRLGSLEESAFEANFGPDSSPIQLCDMPRIAFTDFSYRYSTQLRLPSAADEPAQLIPPEASWTIAREPILRVGAEGLPFAFCHASAASEIFDQVSHVEVEIAVPLETQATATHLGATLASEALENEPVRVSKFVLTPEARSRWVLVPQAELASHRLRWRPHLYPRQDASRAEDGSGGNATLVVGPWQSEGTLALRVELAHIYPREPLLIRATAQLADGCDIITEVLAGVIVELESGSVSPLGPGSAPAVTRRLRVNETLDMVLWPSSIFERGFSQRHAIELSGGERTWTEWQYQTDPRLIMKIEDDFFVRDAIRVRVHGPWSARGGPDPSSSSPEVILAELHLSTRGATPQTVDYTFDRNNAGERQWSLRRPKGPRSIDYRLDVLTLDGRWLAFGPFESALDGLELEIYRERVSDGQASAFGVRRVRG